jgi:hypothetical protein
MKSKLQRVLMASFCSGAVLSGAFQTQAAPVGVDPAQSWLGYLDVFHHPDDGGGHLWGGPWAASDLPAIFSDTSLMLGPNVNTYNFADPYWVRPDGTGNKQVSANFYVEAASLAGSMVTFSGDVLVNTLVSPYTLIAFVKEFTPGTRALVGQATSQLTGSSPFSIQYNSLPGNIIQYGFQTFGLTADPDTVASLGNVEIAIVPEPAALGLFLVGLASLAVLRRKS